MYIHLIFENYIAWMPARMFQDLFFSLIFFHSITLHLTGKIYVVHFSSIIRNIMGENTSNILVLIRIKKDK